MAKYLVDNEEVWSEESAEDAIYSSTYYIFTEEQKQMIDTKKAG